MVKGCLWIVVGFFALVLWSIVTEGEDLSGQIIGVVVLSIGFPVAVVAYLLWLRR